MATASVAARVEDALPSTTQGKSPEVEEKGDVVRKLLRRNASDDSEWTSQKGMAANVVLDALWAGEQEEHPPADVPEPSGSQQSVTKNQAVDGRECVAD